MKQIRAFIVDDEPLARDWLRTLLAEEPGVTLAGEAGDGREAVTALKAAKPDLLFLDVHALDYLLKPFERDRFRLAMERVAVKTDGVIKLVRLADVDFIEAAGRYVTLHVGKEQHLLRETMNDFEAQLDASVFARVHRSAIVNLNRIKELQTESHGEVTIVLEGGRTLRWSRSYRERLETLLGSASSGG